MNTAAMPVSREIADLPAPPALPFLGNAHQLNPRTIHQTMEQWSGRYGPIFRASIGSRQVVVLSDSTAISQVLRARPDTFRRPAVTADISAELGGAPGVLLAEGGDWLTQRRMVMHGFSPSVVKAYFGRLRQVGLRLAQRWSAAAQAQQEMDLSGDLKRYTVDVIAGLAFGEDVNTLQNGDDKLQDHVSVVMAGVARRSLMPFPYWRWLRLPADRRLERSVGALQAATDGFIAQASKALAADPALRAQPVNMLQAMLLAAEKPGSGVNHAVIAGNVSTMLLGGQETTASALAWLIWLLWQHPAALKQAQQEVLDKVADTRTMTPEQLDGLDYVEACALEAMRLKPPAPFLPLQALCETNVLDVRLPADTLLWCVLRYDSVAEAFLPGAQRFTPERWLGDDGAARRLSMQFGAGPRMCPGRYLALMEIKVAMATLLANFEVTQVRPLTGSAPKEVMGFTMMPAPLAITLRQRGPAAAG